MFILTIWDSVISILIIDERVCAHLEKSSDKLFTNINHAENSEVLHVTLFGPT